MTALEIINQILVEIDQRNTPGTFSQAQMLDIVNEGYFDFCWNTEIKEKTVQQTVSSLEAVRSLPSDFIESRQFRWSSNIQLYPKTERDLDYNKTGWVGDVGTPENVVYFNYNTVRLHPIPSAAGTITHRYSYLPAELGINDTPQIMSVYHDALADYGKAQCFWILKKKANAKKYYEAYLMARDKGEAQSRNLQRTPDIMTSQRNVTVFNYPYWDTGYRIR